MQRRKVLTLLTAFLGSTAMLSFAYPILRFFAPPGEDSQNRTLSIKKSDIPIGSIKEVVFSNTPILIINRLDKGFVALSKVCTHLGCLVEYNKAGNILVCPCHGGTYDLEGKVLSGPPPKPLIKFPVRVEGDSILIG